MLAFQFAEWFGEENGLRIVEAGAHDGRLARDILLWLRQMRTKVFGQAEYWLVEPSQFRRRVQKETLAGLEEEVRWLADISELEKKLQSAESDSRLTIIFANELLDAMPVHRLGWDAAKKIWFEWGVALEGDKFAWARMPLGKECQNSGAACQVFRLPGALLEHLPDGFTTEISPAAETWWRQAAGCLREGKLMTIDYGLEEEEFFTPERSSGTLRAYHRHHVSSDLLANPGEQDITAHVNFTALRRAGETAGLRTESFSRQERFLSYIAEQIWKDPRISKWDSAKTRQFQTLTHPEHLGHSFQVLVQSC